MLRSLFLSFSRTFLLLVLGIGLSACHKTAKTEPVRPSFNADSAYSYIQTQVQFGPRVPSSMAHQACQQWLRQTLERMGGSVEVQRGMMSDYNDEEVPVVNITAHFGSRNLNNRILLAAHYDSRPWSDEEPFYEQRFTPIDGANDGASGVGVLLEVARQLGLKQADSTLNHGVDIILFDCEDMGTPSFYTGTQKENTFCLGSQLWSEWRHIRPEKYQFGIVLDMVGAADAVFPKEYYSLQYADNYVEKIWRVANQLGHGNRFSSQKEYPIVDDHYYINTIAKIPCVDIIHYNSQSDTGFPHWWHTQDDNMNNISRETLQAVGEVVMKVIE